MLKKYLHYLTCEKYMELSSKELNSSLSPFEKLSHRFHHLICTFCRRARRQIRVIDEALRNSSNHCCSDSSKINLTPSQKSRVREAIKK